MEGLAGASFAVEAESPQLQTWLEALVQALDGRLLRLPPDSKAAYHAALTLVSNYTVTLYAAAERLLLTLSDDRAAVDGALDALLAATVTNLRENGVPDALTGPLVRGDAGTIAAHLDTLGRHDPQLATVYRELALLTFPILRARDVPTQALEQVLERSVDNAIDDP